MADRILFVFGTRPEAIKVAPVILRMLEPGSAFEPRICVTAQHRGLLDGMMQRFGLEAQHDLDLMQPGQTLAALTSRVVAALEPVLAREAPRMVLVQGDTTTTFAAALAAFYQRIPVGHIEAGLRTGDLSQPFPEELNRVLTTRLASLHFAPTPRAVRQLAAEGVPPDRIFLTGNTSIDALLYTQAKLDRGEWPGADLSFLLGRPRLVVMTAHRRESFGAGFESICRAVRRLAEDPELEIVYPVHPNPNVRGPVEHYLSGLDNVHLIAPLDYVPFVDLMRRADVILTDSGGVQEEAPSLGKPIVVMRDKTERQEAVEAGVALLVGTAEDLLVETVRRLLAEAKNASSKKVIHNPFGDGLASGRILDAIHSFLSK